MTEKSLVIIGAGLSDLSTGCYAQVNGHQSHIFEHHTVPGGVAATWKRKGYIIEGIAPSLPWPFWLGWRVLL
ncbi:MAG: NAD(P)-binding protein [Anaerolineae bacterium]